jgi:hypothetical protein
MYASDREYLSKFALDPAVEYDERDSYEPYLADFNDEMDLDDNETILDREDLLLDGDIPE